jgi:hypothetical protein
MQQPLTESQLFALRWIDTQSHTRSRWMRNGKDAYGDPEKWDAIELSGQTGSIRISLEDHLAIRPYTMVVADRDRKRMYGVTEEGKRLLGQNDNAAAN